MGLYRKSGWRDPGKRHFAGLKCKFLRIDPDEAFLTKISMKNEEVLGLASLLSCIDPYGERILKNVGAGTFEKNLM